MVPSQVFTRQDYVGLAFVERFGKNVSNALHSSKKHSILFLVEFEILQILFEVSLVKLFFELFVSTRITFTDVQFRLLCLSSFRSDFYFAERAIGSSESDDFSAKQYSEKRITRSVCVNLTVNSCGLVSR